MSGFPCELDGVAGTATVEKDALKVGDTTIPWVDVDAVELDGPNVVLRVADGSARTVSKLAREHDDFVAKLRDARNGARRAALLQWTGDAPIDEYDGRSGAEPVRVVLFPDGLTVEGLSGVPATAPFGLIESVERDGYQFTIGLRALGSITFGQLGARTDEFAADFAAAREALAARTAAAYAALSPALEGFPAAAGWAVTPAEAGRFAEALRGAVAGTARGEELDVLESIVGPELRLGLAPLPDGAFFPFALAGCNGKVAVEGTSAEDARATYVFRTDDVDRLNAVLLLLSFRREAIYLPPEELGRWALAARTLEVVRWAREALVDRVPHDSSWETKVRAALS